MPRLISVQTSFTTGEVSFRIKGRSDIEKYEKGLDIAENFRILSQGPIERRNGTIFVQPAKDDENEPRLLRFIISVTQSFILEFGDFYVRFFTLNGAVADLEEPTEPFELETIYSIEEVREIQYSQAENSLILTHRNHIQQELIFNGLDATDWVIQDFITTPPPTFEEGFIPPRTLSLAAQTGLDITFTTDSNANSFSVSDIGRSIEAIAPHFGVGVIKEFTAFDEVEVDIIVDFDQDEYEPGEWLLDLSPLVAISFNNVVRSGGIVTVTSEAAAPLRTFHGVDIGKYILVNGGVLQILSINSDDGAGTAVECEILKSMANSNETENWTLEVSVWNDERGFPGTVTQAQQRVLFASSKVQSQTIWASESGILNGFGLGAEDADAIEIDVLSNEISTIQWISTARDIIIGTTSGESTINVSTTTLTPSSIEITNRTSFGSDSQTPASIGSEVLYIQKGDRKIISYLFDFGTDTFKGEDLTFIAENITETGITQIVYGQEPNKQIYAIRDDGVLITATYDREQGVIGFTRYVTDGQFLSVMTIPKDEKDQVWVVVRRKIQNVDRVFIELFDDSSGKESVDVFTDTSIVVSLPLEITSATNAQNNSFRSNGHGLEVGDKVKFKQFTQWEGIDNIVFTVDEIVSPNTFRCGFDARQQPPYEGGAIVFKTFTEVSGLDHLEQETVRIKTDNAAHPDRVVSNGTIELDLETAEVVVGLKMPYELVTLSKEFDFGAGPMQGQRKRLVSPILRVDSSAPPNVNGEIKPHIREQFNMDQSIPLITGDLEYSSGAWDNTAQIRITGDDVFPLRLLAIYGTVEGNVK